MKRNILGILGLFIGIFGIILSMYFYEKSKREKEPTFIEDPIKSEILNASATKEAPIRIYTLDQNEIKGDLSSTIFYLWNKGKEPIRKDDILKDIIIHFGDSIKIIDFKILKSSRDVCKIKLMQQNNHSIKVDFDILEQNDGFTGQVIFEGSREAILSLSTIIVGVNEISNFALSNYQLFGRILINIGLTLLLGIVLLFLLFVSSPRHDYIPEEVEPDYIALKKTERYIQDPDFQNNVDSLENAVLKTSKIRNILHSKEEETHLLDEPRKKGKSSNFWVRIAVTIGFIITIGLLLLAWYATRNEIINNPIQYIPELIKPK